MIIAKLKKISSKREFKLMNIYSWNVNGIRAIQKKGFVEWVLKEDLDILCIQETKAQLGQLEEKLTQIDGYRSYFFFS